MYVGVLENKFYYFVNCQSASIANMCKSVEKYRDVAKAVITFNLLQHNTGGLIKVNNGTS